MAGQSGQKIKLFYIREFLMRNSDEEHPVSMAEIIGHLESKGIAAERKSIYNDIDRLIDLGDDIIKDNGNYFVGEREFQNVEIRILMDAVQSASFITAEKSKKLVEKIGTLCSVHQMKKLKDRVYIENRVKGRNESIYYTIDKIGEAIDRNKQIECEYVKIHGSARVKSIKEETKKYIINPYAMIWSDDHYYLVANNPKYDNLMHLRIDRIKSVKIIEDNVCRHFSDVPDCEYSNYFDVADYSKKHFGMFSGEIIDIKLQCKYSIIEQVYDSFGDDVFIKDNFDGETFTVITKAAISDGFVSWLMQFPDSIKVTAPPELIEKVKERSFRILKNYQ